MKQKSLNSLRLQLCTLVACLLCAFNGQAWGEEKTYDFGFSVIGQNGWSNSYAQHQVSYTESTVTFVSACKQTSTITSYPVTKGQPVTIVMNGDYTISAASFECQQWGTKAQTITLHYSTDGGSTYTSTGITSSNFNISSSSLPTGTNAVKITFSSTSAQVGIKGATITYSEGGSNPPTPTNPTVNVGTLTHVTELEMHYFGDDIVYINDGDEIEEGTECFVLPVVESGYVLESVHVVDGNNNTIECEGNNGAWSFTMPSTSVTVSATAIPDASLTTFWSEDFGSYNSGAIPTGGTFSYVCTDGGSQTKIYNEKIAGGTAPELLVSKANGSFSATIPLSNVSGNLILSFKANNNNISVSSTTEGVTCSSATSDGNTRTVTISGVTSSATSVNIVFTNTSSSNVRLDDIELRGNGQLTNVSAPTFSLAEGTFIEPQTVELACATDGATIYYSFDNTNWTEYTEALIINETKTVYAKASKGGIDSEVSQRTYTISSILTVAEAIAAYDAAGEDIEGVYVQGVVSKIVEAYNSQYHNISYNISSDGSTEGAQLEAFRGKGLNGDNFTSDNDIQVGDVVVIYGDLTLYEGQIYELKAGNYLISHITKQEPELSYATTEYTVGVNETFATPELINPHNLPITYSISDNNGVATIDTETGAVTIGANAGTVTVTAAFSGNDTYRAGSATYSIKVEAPATEATYVLATSITSGKHYIIVGINGENAYAMGVQNSNNRTAAGVTIEDQTITVSSSDVHEFVIESATGGYSISDVVGGGYLYAASSGSNYLRTQAENDANGIWSITFDTDGSASIVAQGENSRKVMQYNSSSTLFSCYGSASQKPVYLYEKVEVTVGSAGYTTYVTPAAVSFPSSVTAYIVTAINASSMHMEEVTAVPAGTAVVVKAAKGTYTLSTATETVDVDNLLLASDGSITGDGSTIYALGVGKTGDELGVVGFYKVKEGSKVPAGKAYIVVSSSNPVKNYIAFDFGGTDAINAIDNGQLTVDSSVIYNVAGQRIGKMTKGIYVVNGKKVIVK